MKLESLARERATSIKLASDLGGSLFSAVCGFVLVARSTGDGLCGHSDDCSFVLII